MTDDIKELVECLKNIVEFHNKYDIAYSQFNKDTIKPVIQAKKILKKYKINL